MSKERFEVFRTIIKDNEDIPSLLNNYQATVRLNELNDKVKELKQELTEKQNTIDKINKEFVQAVHDWKVLCAEKDNLIEFGKEEIRKRNKRIDEIVERDKKLFEEKGKEIEKLKRQYTILENENGKLTTDLIMDKYKKAQKEVSFGKQLSIQKLEEVKKELRAKLHLLDSSKFGYLRHFVAWHDICDQINKQIKELKGEL